MTGSNSAIETVLTSKEISPETRLNLQKAGFDAAKKKLRNWFKDENSQNFFDPGDELKSERVLPTYLYICNYCSPPEDAISRKPS